MATVANRLQSVQGPFKMEVLNLTAVTDADTVSTLMQRTVFAIGVIGSDNSPATAAVNIGIAGKVLTINSTDCSGDEEVNVLVFGF